MVVQDTWIEMDLGLLVYTAVVVVVVATVEVESVSGMLVIVAAVVHTDLAVHDFVLIVVQSLKIDS